MSDDSATRKTVDSEATKAKPGTAVSKGQGAAKKTGSTPKTTGTAKSDGSAKTKPKPKRTARKKQARAQQSAAASAAPEGKAKPRTAVSKGQSAAKKAGSTSKTTGTARSDGAAKTKPKPKRTARKKQARAQQSAAASAAPEGKAKRPVQEEEAAPSSKVVSIPPSITVRNLSSLINASPIDLIRELMKNGVMATINQEIDFDTAAVVVTDMGYEVEEERPPEPVEKEPVVPRRKRREYTAEELAKLEQRPPVVTIMGHVDHGKTSLLDVIREANVAASESGGITQHIGAYQVEKQGKRITFLDTPGHEAFTAMRARGAMATDIAILVVAADDGVQPQTLEAIDHARAAQVPIIVALNKMDKRNANPEVAKKQLSDAGVLVEDYGGEVICVPVSAMQKTGLENLLEMILLVAEMGDLKALTEAPASGTVIEGRLDRSRGPLATLLIQEGTLHTGDNLVVGALAGRVRAMFDERGQRMQTATPSTPVAIMGLSSVPVAGEAFRVVEDERTARTLAAAEATRHREAEKRQEPKLLSLTDFFAQAQAGEVKELNIIFKADVQGAIEPVVNSVEKLGDESLKAQFLHTGTGNINESDIMLAVASKAIVIGFNVQTDTAASRMARAERVDVRLYDVIYRLIDDIDKAMKGLLEPVYERVPIGHASVKAVFRLPNKTRVAGCQVQDGIAARNALVRVIRNKQEIFDGQVSSLRRFQDDVREVSTGMECGVGVQHFHDFEVGDILEFYRKEQVGG